MKRGQKTQSRIRHQRAVGRYKTPYQRGGIIRNPPNPWRDPYDDWPVKRISYLRGGKVRPIVYPWKKKGKNV